jgi:bifunctional non-homologous end joining protein LigD
MRLQAYTKKRQLKKSPEPASIVKKTKNKNLIFVVQEHHASHLHYDFRLEMGGVLKSWAIPKGPSLDPKDKRLAVNVEDHPYAYKNFEGTIPQGHYGAGEVIIWDEGEYIPLNEGAEVSEKALLHNFKKGHLSFLLEGHRLHGEFSLVKIKDRKNKKENLWLLIKKEDEFASH